MLQRASENRIAGCTQKGGEAMNYFVKEMVV